MSAIQVDKKVKRDEIILAALKEFLEKGFVKTTIQDIAGRAGIGKGTVYEYFKNKEEIIHNSFICFKKYLEVDMRNVILSDKKGSEKLNELIQLILGSIRAENKDFIDLMFDFWAEGIRSHSKGKILPEVNKFYLSYRNLFKDILLEGIEDGSIKRSIDPVGVSAIIIGMLDGIMVQWILDKKSIDLKSVGRNLAELVVNGVGNQK